ncbi:Ribonuclease H domain [Sesbania bispinosa]|nr:Ribonuclease H domain [Sesbania bispinosa]
MERAQQSLRAIRWVLTLGLPFARLQDGFHARIEDGRSNMWYDKWLPGKPLCQLVVDYVDIHDLQVQAVQLSRSLSYFSSPAADLPPRVARTVHWIAPPEGCVALNVDGSSHGNPGPSGFGGLLRDHLGNWLKGFYGHMVFSEILQAELLAIRFGLLLAWEEGYRNIICWTDSMLALSLITAPVLKFHKYSSILEGIARLVHQEWNVTFKHILREGNSCADWLAKLGVQNGSTFVVV